MGGFATSGSGGYMTGGSAGYVTGGFGGVGTGGVATGGYFTGGVATGGYYTGGVATGGYYTGGVATGGVATGGVATGGVATGGVATGGVATGGVATGGVATGGTATGGAGGSTCAAEALYPNLVNDTGWVGCDPALTTDNPAGIQGAFYTYGDGITCTPPTGNPCTAAGCCLSGTTIVDTTYASWGCGIGLDLNSSGGATPVKSAYSGTATCFDIVLSGSSGGNPVRVQFTQSASPNISPYLEIPAFTAGYSGTVCFADVTCPTWATAAQCSLTGTEYDIQIQVPGGDRASTFNICLTSLEPNTLSGTGGTGTGGTGTGGTATGGTSTGGTATGGTATGGTATGGTAGTATGGSTCAAEALYPNLVNETGWVGCVDTLATDNPAGIQGAFYTYGDGITCDPPTGNPCTAADGCCLTGATIVDTTYASWGCGIGLDLNSSGGTTPVKSAYTGDATCFDITLTGNSGGNTVRVQFTQSASPDVSPYLDIGVISGTVTETVCFTDVVCPTWATAEQCALTGTEYDLQLQVPGGDMASTFNICLTSLIPNSLSGTGGTGTGGTGTGGTATGGTATGGTATGGTATGGTATGGVATGGAETGGVATGGAETGGTGTGGAGGGTIGTDLGPWDFAADLSGWHIDAYSDPAAPTGTTATWIDTGTCAGLGCIEFSVPFAAADAAANLRYDQTAGDMVDMTGMTISFDIYVEAGTGGGIQLFVSTGEAGGYVWNAIWINLSDLAAGWNTVSFDFDTDLSTTDPVDPTMIEGFGIQLSAGAAGPWTDPTVILVDTVTITAN